MRNLRIKKESVEIVVLAAVLIAGPIIATSIQNQNTNLLIYQNLLSYANIPSNQPISPKADLIWSNKTVNSPETYSNMEIILNGNLIIAEGGSLVLTNVTLRVNCTLNGEHRIEVQSGGALYINDTDGNPNTRNDATNITSYNPDFKFNFWVRSGATFQMYNSEIHYCGYWDNNYNRHGLWINTNNAIIENNTFTNGYCGIILQNAQYNTIKNNYATKNTVGFYLYSSSYNTLTGNTAVNNNRDGFRLYSDNHHNTLTGNTAIDNANWGFVLSYSSDETLTDNTAINSGEWGFQLHYTTSSTLMRNNATNNGKDGFWIYASSNNNLIRDNIAINSKRYGFYLHSVSGNNLENNRAINNKYGIYLIESSNNILRANQVINSSIQAYYLDGNSLNNDFTGSVVLNYLRVEVLGDRGGVIQGADVKVEVNGNMVYASPGFGGTNSSTNNNGLTDWIPVPYKVYTSGTTAVEKITRITVRFFELTVANNPRVVNMTSSHKETFIVNGIDASLTTEIGAGLNQQVDASAQVGVELSLNLTSSVSLSIFKTNVSLGGSPPSGLDFIGRFISIIVNDTSAIQGITITIHYTNQEVSIINLNESSLALWYWNESSGIWVQLPSKVDSENNIVTAYADHLTHFAVLGTPLEPPIPPYLMFILLFQLTQSELSPLIFLALGLVVVAILTVMGVIILKSREEMAPEIKAPTPIAGRIRCPYCGSEISENHNFCMFCGRARPKR